jgi:hypothetical protein
MRRCATAALTERGYILAVAPKVATRYKGAKR